MSRGGYPFRMPRCYVCGRIAGCYDKETGDELCAFCYHARLDQRAALKALQEAKKTECTCKGPDDLCPGCRERARQRYRDEEVPVAFMEAIETVPSPTSVDDLPFGWEKKA